MSPEEMFAKPRLPVDAAIRKASPIATGLLDFFPLACAAIANLSVVGCAKHTPGKLLHWAREKSTDHADCIVRHLVDRGTVDTDGVRHATKVAWRALALLELEIEADKPFIVPEVVEPYPEGCEHCKGWTRKCHKEAASGDVCGHECEYPVTAAERAITYQIKVDERLPYFCPQHRRWHDSFCPSCAKEGSSR